MTRGPDSARGRDIPGAMELALLLGAPPPAQILIPAQLMGKSKVLVKVNPDGKYVVDLDKEIDPTTITPGARVALRNDAYTLHVLLPSKVDPLVSLMKVEKVPDSTYDMVGGLDQQIKEIKEVSGVARVWGEGGGGARL